MCVREQWKVDVRIEERGVATYHPSSETGSVSLVQQNLTSEALRSDLNVDCQVIATLPAWTTGVVVASPDSTSVSVLPDADCSSASLQLRSPGANSTDRVLKLTEREIQKEEGDEILRKIDKRLVRSTIRKIHEPTTPNGERTFDLVPLDTSELPPEVIWDGLSDKEFSRPIGSRVHVAHPERWGTNKGEIKSVQFENQSGEDVFTAQVAFESPSREHWERRIPLGHLESTQPMVDSVVHAKYGVPRWSFITSTDGSRTSGACNIRVADACDLLSGGSWTKMGVDLPEFSLIDLTKVFLRGTKRKQTGRGDWPWSVLHACKVDPNTGDRGPVRRFVAMPPTVDSDYHDGSRTNQMGMRLDDGTTDVCSAEESLMLAPRRTVGEDVDALVDGVWTKATVIHVYASGAYALRVADTTLFLPQNTPLPFLPQSVRAHVTDEYIALKLNDLVEIRKQAGHTEGAYITARVNRTPELGTHQLSVLNICTKGAVPETVCEVEIRNRLPVGVISLLVAELVTLPADGKLDATPFELVQRAVQYLTQHSSAAVLESDTEWVLPWIRRYQVETAGLLATVGTAVLDEARSGKLAKRGGPDAAPAAAAPRIVRLGAPPTDRRNRGAVNWFDTTKMPFSVGRHRASSPGSSDEPPGPARALLDEFRSVVMGIAFAAHAATSPTM